MPSITRSNHYVPQATLRRWSIDGQRVWAYRLLVSNAGIACWRHELISRLARQTDFYTERRGGQDVDSFETFLTRRFEEPGQQAIARMLEGARMTATDWRAIARFVVTQDLRTPQDFLEWTVGLQERIQESLESALDKVKARVARTALPDVSPPRTLTLSDTQSGYAEPGTSANAFSDVFKITIERSQAADDLVPVRASLRSVRSAWLARTRHLLTGRAEIVSGHHWCKMIPSLGEEWPLTDHPVLRLNYNSPSDYDFGGGWGHSGSEFIMPVSPRLAVYTQVAKHHSGPILLDEPRTRQIQRLLVERARRWILVRQPAPWIEQFRPRIVDADRFKC